MTIKDGIHEPINGRCEGCNFVKQDLDGTQICAAYLEPRWHWMRDKKCPLSTHMKCEPTMPAEKKRIGQQHRIKQPKLSKKQQAAYARLG